MRSICEDCGWTLAWTLIEEFTDDKGRKWEVYQCPRCGNERRYCVG